VINESLLYMLKTFWVSGDVKCPSSTVTVSVMYQMLPGGSKDTDSVPHGAAFGCSSFIFERQQKK